MEQTTAGWSPVPAGRVGRWRWQASSGRTVWDADCCALFGSLPGEAPEAAWARAVHPADQDRMLSGEVWAGREVHTFRVRHPDGSVRYLLSRLTEVQDAADPARWIAGVTVDVTDSQDDHARAVVALQSMTDGFIAVDHDLRFTYVNSVAAALFGARVPVGQLLGRRLWEIEPAVAGSAVQRAWEQALRTGEAVSFESRDEPSGRWFTSDVRPSADGLFVYFRDSTDRHEAAAEQQRLLDALARQAATDALTGLGNGPELRRRLGEHLAASPAASAVVLFCDLDRFKLVNDTLGHSAGDELLRAVGERLVRAAGPGALVARSGGDEFVVALPDSTDEDAEALAQRVMRSLCEPVEVAGRVLHCSTSVGLATGGHGTDVDALLRNADLALYRAKDAGRAQLAWYDHGLHQQVLERVALERDLRAALDDPEQLQLHYQPSYSLASGQPTGVEALLRWHHPERGPVSPAEVIPVAEESGLILPLGELVIARAAAQAAAWRGVRGLTTWVNVSPRQLEAGDVAGALRRALASNGLDPRRFGVEVTESVLGDRCWAGRALAEVAALGVRTAIDDFGTGYSSLSRLLAMPVDLVKIDRSFVTAAGTPPGRAVLEGIVDLAHGIGASAIAEGVETWDQLAQLRGTRCDDVSGFLLARPAPAAQQPLTRVRLSPQRTSPGRPLGRPAPALR